MEVDQGRVISFAISMTFTLIANISSVKVRGHVSTRYRVGGKGGGRPRPRAGRGGGWAEFEVHGVVSNRT